MCKSVKAVFPVSVMRVDNRRVYFNKYVGNAYPYSQSCICYIPIPGPSRMPETVTSNFELGYRVGILLM